MPLVSPLMPVPQDKTQKKNKLALMKKNTYKVALQIHRRLEKLS